MTLRRSTYNAAQRAKREEGECAEMPRVFRVSNGLGWEKISFARSHRQHAEQQVLPLNDLRPHDEASTCWCGPVEYEPGVWGHFALDGRDRAERGEVAIQ